MDLMPEVQGSPHIFKRIKDDDRKPLTFAIDESKLSKAGLDVTRRKEQLEDLRTKQIALEQSREPLREEFQRLATLHALGESAIADVDKAKTRLAQVEKELRSLEDSDTALVGEIELAQNVLNELQNRKAAAIEAERLRVLRAESTQIRQNLAAMLTEARKLDELTTDTAVKFNELSSAGLVRTHVSEYPSFESCVHAFFNRYELYLPPEEG
jgi:predicted nuclease with TOPRIM domain